MVQARNPSYIRVNSFHTGSCKVSRSFALPFVYSVPLCVMRWRKFRSRASQSAEQSTQQWISQTFDAVRKINQSGLEQREKLAWAWPLGFLALATWKSLPVQLLLNKCVCMCVSLERRRESVFIDQCLSVRYGHVSKSKGVWASVRLAESRWHQAHQSALRFNSNVELTENVMWILVC